MKRIAQALDALSVCAFMIDHEHKVVGWNSACGQLTGIPAAQIVGTNRHWTAFYTQPRPCLADLVLDKAVDKMSQHYDKVSKAEFALEAYRAEGWFDDIGGKRRYLTFEARPVLNRQRVIGAVEVLQDITEYIEARERIAFMTDHDLLTGLPNRVLLEDRIRQLIARASRTGEGFALAALDIDRFKVFNEALGHSGGDLLLQDIARRIQEAIRGADTVSRQGGDEFMLLLPSIEDRGDILHLIDKVATAIAGPCHVGDRQVKVLASVGVALFPVHGETVEDLVKHANTALYHAKDSGRNNVQIYDDRLVSHLTNSMTLEGALKAAIPGQLFIEYQPQLSLLTRSPLGSEALIRWRHPEMGVIRPDIFIPLAESSGLIHDVGAWVLRRSCDLIRETGIPVAVNLSAHQFTRSDLFDTVEDAARGIEPGLLTLEITESAFIGDFDAVRRTLERLKGLGLKIALDDFGTGYSSLTYLRRLPIDYIKIDQSFIRDRGSRPIVQAIIGMAESLGMATIAEGVEAPEQIAFLERQGCTAIQGYYYSRPIDNDSFIRFIRSQAPARKSTGRSARRAEPVLSWSFTFATGIASIDAQHKKLISIINRLHQASSNKKGIRAIINEMTDYAGYHFAHEEHLMGDYDLPSAAAHIAEHRDFVAKAAEFGALDGEATPPS